MAKRRPHSKTRTGCKVCKSRKVKCDETRPSCRNCRRRGIPCDFAVLGSNDQASPGSQEASYQGTPSSDDPRRLQPQIAPDGFFTPLDMELLHHFTTSTCLSFSLETTTRNFWRINLPQLAFTRPYLMRAILSLSALHLARSRPPEQREALIEAGMAHHAASCALAIHLMYDIDPDSVMPMYFFSMITLYSTCASPKEDKNMLLVSKGVVPHWLYLFRGVRTVLAVDGGRFTKSDLGSRLLNTGREMNAIWESPDHYPDHEGLNELENVLHTNLYDDPAKLQILLRATEGLKKSFAVIYGSASDELRGKACFMWVFKAEDDFIDLLKIQSPEALCVLAFFCVLLRRLSYLWWLEGWGVHLIDQIYTVLGAEHRHWIQWAIQETGWVPTS